MPLTVQLPPEVTTQNIYPAIEPSWLTCPSDPTIPEGLHLDTQIPYPSLEDAWFECAAKLQKIRELVATWPKQ